MKTVTVTVTPEGETKIEVAGVTGTGCHELTRAIEQAIGQTVSDQHTPDLYRSPGQAVSQQRDMPA